ncbi:MAG: hypothetical protein ACYC7E_00155 [Armatimonadota bacterium]
MECPKCGFYLDAFTTECPRCKQQGQKTGAQAVATPAPAPAPVQPAAQTGYTSPVQRPAAYSASGSGSVTFGLRQLLAIAGALILLAGIFLPLVNVPLLGGVSLFQASKVLGAASQFGSPMSMMGSTPAPSEGAKLGLFIGKYLWIILLALGLGGMAAAILRRYLYLWISGGASAAIALFLIIGYFVSMAKANAAIKSAMASNPMASAASGKMMSATALAPLGIGPVLILIGAILLLTAATLQSEDA